MSAITVEEALKKYDRRLYSQKLRDETVNGFLDNVKKYISKTSKAISDGESDVGRRILVGSDNGL